MSISACETTASRYQRAGRVDHAYMPVGPRSFVGYRSRMTSSPQVSIERSRTPQTSARREEILSDPRFGVYFTDHMYVCRWTPDTGWHGATVKPYGPFSIDPATSVLHYAQEVFEGLKAYRHPDGSVWLFRPEVNAARFARSAARLALPVVPEGDFIAALEALVTTDIDWVPSVGGADGSEKSLYLRPFMFASEVFLGVRPAKEVVFTVIASPAGSYFDGGVRSVSIWLSEELTRAAPGGTGAAKCGGNYAASLLAQQEAAANGCEQVVFLDAAERSILEELGGMNLFFVYADGSLATPELNGSILEGVTRASLIELAEDLGHKVDERAISIDEWREGVARGEITEVFACGTAAVVTPVAALRWRGGELASPMPTGEVTMQLRNQLLDIQYGRAADSHGWLHRVG
ncbi:MAG: branched-chain amino acid aminotransferase [Nocardioidaceae bacterium]|jgi:branched-chain amino acid aminotransferase|nr:branched-chain amino acid aminotransferase [Nocardioidaceae bacterium]